MLKLPLINFPIWFFVRTALKLMISLKKGHEIHHLTNIHHFRHCALWQPMAVQDVLMRNAIAHRLSPSEAVWWVTIQDVPMKRIGFLTIEAWWIRRIRSSRLTRQRALWYLSRVGQAEWSWLSEDSANVWQGRTGQNMEGWGQNEERTGYFPRLKSLWYFGWSHHSFSMSYMSN